jgi:hypothetical protein
MEHDAPLSEALPAKTLTMTVVEPDGTSTTSDITQWAEALFALGTESTLPSVEDGVELLTLELSGAWAWPEACDNDTALERIGAGIREAITSALERVDPATGASRKDPGT